MELTEAPRGDRPFVESYGPGGFRIGGERWTGSVLILADRVVAWELGDAAVPDAEALAAAFAVLALRSGYRFAGPFTIAAPKIHARSSGMEAGCPMLFLYKGGVQGRTY